MRTILSTLLFCTLAALLLATSVSAGADLYSGKDTYIVELTESNFNELVLQSNDIWLVEFFAPWCGHCQSLAPKWIEAASALSGIVRVGAVDMDKQQEVGRPYDVKGLPTIKIFGADKKKPTTYEGPRETKDIVSAGLKATKELVKARLAGKAQASKKAEKKSSGSKPSASSSGSDSGNANAGPPGKVIDATEKTFAAEVLDNDDFVMVEFFAPWCGHCKSLAPEWKKAAAQLGGVAKLVAVDATVHTSLASKYDIKGYPTILVFKPGKKQTPEPYNGGRTSNDIAKFARSGASTSSKPRPVVQVTSLETLNEQCKEKASLCLVTFVPHILDGGAKARNAVLDTLKQVATKNKAKPFSYVWLEAGSAPALEETLLMGNTQYPGVVALNAKKGRFSPMLGSFTADSIGDFLGRVVSGKEGTVPFDSEKIVLPATSAWDGKDAPAEKEL